MIRQIGVALVMGQLPLGDESMGSTSSGLLERVKAQDEQAWHRLVQLYGPLVLFWCRIAGLSHEDRADVAQEVFRAVAQHIARFHKDRPDGTFRGWLRAVTRSKLADHLARNRHRLEALGGSEAQQILLAIPDALSASDSHRTVMGERSLLIRQALERIRPDFESRTWTAFWRTAVDGLVSSAVAEELGITPVAVRMAKSRVLARLRIELDGSLD